MTGLRPRRPAPLAAAGLRASCWRPPRRAGAEWVQLDEPALATDLADAAPRRLRAGLRRAAAVPVRKVLLTTSFGGVVDEHPWLFDLPVDGMHLDLVRDPHQLAPALDTARPDEQVLSAGVVDGRNVWRTDLRAALDRLGPRRRPPRRPAVGGAVLLAAARALRRRRRARPRSRRPTWLAFAQQKLARGRHAGPGAHRRLRRRSPASWRPATRSSPPGAAALVAGRSPAVDGRRRRPRPTTSGRPRTATERRLSEARSAAAAAADHDDRLVPADRRDPPRPAATTSPARSATPSTGRSARPRSPR